MAVAPVFPSTGQWSLASIDWLVSSCLFQWLPWTHQEYWQGTQAKAVFELGSDRPHAIPTILGLVHAGLSADSAPSLSAASQVVRWIAAIALASNSCGDGQGVGTGFSQRLRGDRFAIGQWVSLSLTGLVSVVVGRTVTYLLMPASVTVRRVAHWIVDGDYALGSWLDSPGVIGRVDSCLRGDRPQSYREMQWAVAPTITVDSSVPLSPLNQTVPATVRRVAHWAIALLLIGKKGQSFPGMQESIPTSLPGCSSRYWALVPSTIPSPLPTHSLSLLLPVQLGAAVRLPKPNQSISRFLPLNKPGIASGIAASIPHWVLPDVVTAFCAAMITAFCAAISAEIGAAVIDGRLAAEEQAVSNIRVT